MDLPNISRRRNAEVDLSPSVYEYLDICYSRLESLLRSKVHQCRSLLRNRDLIRAVLTESCTWNGGSRFRFGDVLKVFGDDGRCVRLAIRGSRNNAIVNTYFAVDLDDLMPCYVKALRESESVDPLVDQIWRREASLSLRLPPHPNLVKTFEIFFHQRKLHLRTEYIRATELDRLMEDGHLRLRDAMVYAIHLCRALVTVQSVFPGFVHGNLNPDCCLIARDGTLKLSDLGRGTYCGTGVPSLSPTKGTDGRYQATENSVRLFPQGNYTAPELLDGDAPIAISSDIYSFGVLLLEMVCGRYHGASLPIGGQGANRINSLNSSRLLSVRDFYPELADLVHRCLSASPDERPIDFSVLEHQLGVMIDERFPGSAPLNTTPELTETEIAGRALSLSLLGNSGDASDYLDSALGGIDLSESMLTCKVKVNLHDGRIQEAIEASRTALRMGTGRCSARIDYARTLMAQSQFKTALNFVFRAIKLEPHNRQALILAGKLLQNSGELDEASYFLHRCLALDPRTPEVLEQLADLNFMKGDFDLSIKFGLQAVALDPWSERARRILGDAYFAKGGERFKAIGSFKAALRSSATGSPSTLETARRFVRCSHSLLESSGHEVSLETVKLLIIGSRLMMAEGIDDRSTAFIKGFVKIFYRRDLDQLLLFCLDEALVRSISGATGSAVSELRSILNELIELSAVFPLHFNPLFSLSKLLFELKAYAECQTMAFESIRRFGPNEGPYFQIAASYEKQGDLRSARRYYKKALNISGREDTIRGIRRVKAEMNESRWSYRGIFRSHLRRVGLLQ